MSLPISILKTPTKEGGFFADLQEQERVQPQKLSRTQSASTLSRRTSTSRVADIRHSNGTEINLSCIEQNTLIRCWCCDDDGPLGLSIAYGLPAFTQADLSQHETTALKLIKAVKSQAAEIRLPTLYALADNSTVTPAVIQAIANIPDIQQATIQLSSQSEEEIPNFAATVRSNQQEKKAAGQLPAESQSLSAGAQREKLKRQIATCVKSRLPESPRARRVSFDTQQSGIAHYEAYSPIAKKISQTDSHAELEAINSQDPTSEQRQKPIHNPVYNAYQFPEEDGWLSTITAFAIPILTGLLSGRPIYPPKKLERKTSAPALHFEPETLQDLVTFAEDVYQTAKQQDVKNPGGDPLFLSLKHKIIHHPKFQQFAIETAEGH